MRAVVSVVGKDTVGILAKVSTECAKFNANITEITQSVLTDVFAMIMIIDISKLEGSFADLSDTLSALGDSMGLKIHVMHEDIFNVMHHI